MPSKIVWLVAMTGLTVYAPTAAKAESVEHGWSLVWADEFNGTKLDRKKWKPEKSCWGGGNQERQCYTDRPQNIKVADGKLHLIARKETFTGPDRPPEIADKTKSPKDAGILPPVKSELSVFQAGNMARSNFVQSHQRDREHGLLYG